MAQAPVLSDRARTWLFVIALSLALLLWGLFLFFAIGDKGPPTWDFGAVEDVPGQSPYSTQRNSEVPK